MDANALEILTEEMRADYQIPPYTPHEVIGRALQGCAARLSSLRPGADFEHDLLARNYLKAFAYYELTHRREEFLQNYGPDIRAWQLSEEVAEDEA